MLRKQNHKTFEDVSSDLTNLDDTKEEKVTFANRAPVATDKGRFWYDYSANRFYGRNLTTGAWNSSI